MITKILVQPKTLEKSLKLMGRQDIIDNCDHKHNHYYGNICGGCGKKEDNYMNKEYTMNKAGMRMLRKVIASEHQEDLKETFYHLDDKAMSLMDFLSGIKMHMEWDSHPIDLVRQLKHNLIQTGNKDNNFDIVLLGLLEETKK